MRRAITVALVLSGLALIAIGLYPQKPPARPGITFEFGGCQWTPPSPKAAAAFVSYFYGLDPNLMPADYEAIIEQQLVAAGETPERAHKEMAMLDRCFSHYVVPAKDRSP